MYQTFFHLLYTCVSKYLYVTHWTILLSVSGDNHIDILYNPLECLVHVFRRHLQCQYGQVQLVHEQNWLDSL